MSRAWTVFGPRVRGRNCGSCTACCVQVPVKGMGKPANTPCAKLCSRGCSIYKTRPRECRLWSCRWLMDPTTANLRRPDKSGYVIDAMLDTLFVDGRPLECVQVWVDPARPDAHEDPALRAWLAGVAEELGLPALIRWSSTEAMALFAPSLTGSGRWVAKGSSIPPISREEVERRRAEAGAPMKIMAVP